MCAFVFCRPFFFPLVFRCCCCRCCFCHRYHVAECCRSSRLFCLQLSFSFDNMRVTRFSSSSSCFSLFGSVACRRISSPSAAAAASVRVFLCLFASSIVVVIVCFFVVPLSAALSSSSSSLSLFICVFLWLSLCIFLRSEIPVS